VTALVIAAWKFGGPADPKVQGVNTLTQPVTRVVALTVRATTGASFMEVRIGSRTGKPLYQGTLERGQVQRFGPRRLYLSLRSPGNVVVRVDGRRVKLPKSGELIVPAHS
jgi:hypothetical protein